MKVAKKDLQNIRIEVTDGGFTVWITEKKKVRGEIITFQHWILDGSLLKEDGLIRLGSPNNWKINAKLDESSNTIVVTRS